MNQQISNKLTVIRVISMIFIVLCHYLQFFDIYLAFWFNVGVQIFFIISGVLYGNKDVNDFKKFWKSKFFKIILPYLIVVLCFLGYCFIINNKPFNLIDIFYYLTMSQAFNTGVSSLAHLWFISYILLFYLILPVLQKFDISEDKYFYLKLILIIIGLQCLQILNVINVNITYLSLFIVAYYFSRRYFKNNIKDNYKIFYIITLGICLIGIPLQLFLERYQFTGIVYKLFIIYHDYVHAFLGINLFLLFMKIIPDVKNKFISYVSNISYYVYLIHQIFILGTFTLLNYNFGIIYSLLAIIVCSNLLYYICKYINRKALK